MKKMGWFSWKILVTQFSIEDFFWWKRRHDLGEKQAYKSIFVGDFFCMKKRWLDLVEKFILVKNKVDSVEETKF